jgi:hypothetical protein
MAEEKKKKYPPGKNPNSLKNLKKGRFGNSSEIAVKAQAKSVVARNMNKMVRETLLDFLMRPDPRTDFVERMMKYGWTKDEATHFNEVHNGLILKAKAGDVSAIKLLYQLVGIDIDENPSVNVNVNSGSVITLGDKVFEE